MPIDDLMKGLSMFQDSMQSLAINQGIKQATQQVDQINQSAMDELQKRQARTQLSTQLGLQLNGMGADASHIQLAQQAVAPPPMTSPEDMYQQAVQTGDPKLMKMAKDAQSFKEVPEMDKVKQQGANSANVAHIEAQGKIDAANVTAGNKATDKQMKVVNAFDKEAKPLLDAVNSIGVVQSLLSIDKPNSPADNGARMAFARASGEKSRIAYQELQGYSGNQSVKDQLDRSWNKFINGGTLDPNDREVLKQAAQVTQDTREKQLKDTIAKHADRMEQYKLADPGQGAKLLAAKDPLLMKLAGIGQPAAGAPPAPSDDPSTWKVQPFTLPSGQVIKVRVNPKDPTKSIPVQ